MPASSALLPVFNALPGAYLLLSPDLVVVAASDAYLAASLRTREQVVGRPVFDVFPDNPRTPEANSQRNLRASFAQVLATGQPHEVPPQRYDVPDPAAPGQFVERHWLPHNSAVLDEQGQVIYLIHSVIDITNQEQAEARVRASQQREQAALAEAERQRGELERIFEQAPVAIAVYRGPNNIIELANPLVCELWGRRAEDIIGLSLFEALPEVAGMGYEELLAGVFTTGEPYVAHEMPAQHDRNGHRETVYWNFVYLPVREADGHITGVMVVATEVTEQVVARQQVQDLNQQLATLNQALHTSNEELLTNQEEVLLVQQQLEGRVQERTQQLEASLLETEQQRTQATKQQRLLDQILGQVPAAIATLTGPEHRFSFFNDTYQRVSGHRAQLGQTVAEVFPEAIEQGFGGLLDQVYATGQPFRGQETPIQLHNSATGQSELLFIDFIYQPLLGEQAQTEGILAFIVDVTERVVARQHAEALQAQVQASAQRQAQDRELVYQVFAHTPAAVAILRGPALRYEYVNAAYQSFFPGRQLVGRPLAEALPEATASGELARLEQVYRTGETYFGEAVPVQLAQPGEAPRLHHFTFTYQAYREQDTVVGVSIFAHEVSAPTPAR
ncbi:PAS domain-containing protein [Hymenobacter cheonanensis]|uniref:PAS domain-containing protein n=1 Tax=Hymenobacter sp. CA2-7 TaxID=3063993 RepID=UPI0027124ED6|nr:PAS domain-containing protein [Hymenobacter sp. CA2-7]MDO7884583.1 PAS domain-containing protein [Hymenobacter sp. CA2-7]